MSIKIALAGNPNSGKTTLFNALTGSNQFVGNWPGVTVEKKEGKLKKSFLSGEDVVIIDLPGVYSLSPYTLEEVVARNYLVGEKPDAIINIIDGTNLERNLYLSTQLIELGIPMVMAVNMMDIVEKRGMEIDMHRLPEMLGIPVIPVSARKRTGLSVLLHAAAHHRGSTAPDVLIHNHKKPAQHMHNHHADYAMVYSDELEDKIDEIIPVLQQKYPGLTNYRWYALKLLEQHPDTKLFVVGEYGRRFFAAHNIPIEHSFLYTAQNPTMARAREISALLLDGFGKGGLEKIFLVYTDMASAVSYEARSTRLLPFHRAHFADSDELEKPVTEPFEFLPDVRSVLDSMIPSYVSGFIYSALIDSFCCEQNARMTAMDSANQNAEKLLGELSLEFNRVRQSAITQEITEISAGARAQRNHVRR